MKTKDIAVLLIALLGLHSLYIAASVGLMPLLQEIIAMLKGNSGEFGTYLSPMGIFSVGPLVFGLPLVFFADPIATFLLRRCKADGLTTVALPKTETAQLAFALLGCSLLYLSIAGFVRYIGGHFQQQLMIYDYAYGNTTEPYIKKTLAEFLYHVTCLIFSLLILLRGAKLYEWLTSQSGQQARGDNGEPAPASQRPPEDHPSR